MLDAQACDFDETIRCLVPENVQGILRPNRSRHRRPLCTTLVGVHQCRIRGRCRGDGLVRLPCRSDLLSPHSIQQRGDRVRVTHRDTIGTTQLACSDVHTEPARSPRQSRGSFYPRAFHLQPPCATCQRQRTPCQERPTPYRFGFRRTTPNDLRGHAPDRPTPTIDQSGPPGHVFCLVGDVHHVTTSRPDVRQHAYLRRAAV